MLPFIITLPGRTFLEAADQLLLITITSGLKMHHRESFTDNAKLQWDRTRSVLTIFAHSNKTAIIMLKMMMEGCPRLQAICYANNERLFEFKSFCMPTASYSREHNRSRSFRCLSQLLNKHSGSARNIGEHQPTTLVEACTVRKLRGFRVFFYLHVVFKQIICLINQLVSYEID